MAKEITLGQILEGKVSVPKLAAEAIKAFVAAVQTVCPHVQAVYAADEGEKVRALTVVPHGTDKMLIHDAERSVRWQFPFLSFGFRVLSVGPFTLDEIEDFRKMWLSNGKLVYSASKRSSSPLPTPQA